MTAVRLATRQSALALAQTGLVADALRAAWPEVEIQLVPVVTEGDRRRDVATTAIGGKGVFTAAVQEAVLEGRADLAVHSAKDLPASQPGAPLAEDLADSGFQAGWSPPLADDRPIPTARFGGRADRQVWRSATAASGGLGDSEDRRSATAASGGGGGRATALVLAAVPERGDPRDVLVARRRVHGLDELPAGARVGTGSPRRVALLRFLRPDLELVPIRGNVDTRLGKVRSGELDAVVLAAAGLQRLGLGDEPAVALDPEVFTPAPAQGCLAVEAREDDTRLLGMVSAITHRPSRVALRGERAFLAKLGGSCTLPAGALLTRPADGRLEIRGFLAAADGKGLVRERLAGPADDPESLGEVLAARLLETCGPEVRALVDSSRQP